MKNLEKSFIDLFWYIAERPSLITLSIFIIIMLLWKIGFVIQDRQEKNEKKFDVNNQKTWDNI